MTLARRMKLPSWDALVHELGVLRGESLAVTLVDSNVCAASVRLRGVLIEMEEDLIVDSCAAHLRLEGVGGADMTIGSEGVLTAWVELDGRVVVRLAPGFDVQIRPLDRPSLLKRAIAETEALMANPSEAARASVEDWLAIAADERERLATSGFGGPWSELIARIERWVDHTFSVPEPDDDLDDIEF